jgi:hypothetical protein
MQSAQRFQAAKIANPYRRVGGELARILPADDL